MTERNLISPDEVADLLGISRRTLYRALKRQSLEGFPDAYRYSNRLTRWDRDEVQKWMEERRAPKV
jgi:excisionase family DNA binding protein